MTSTRAPIAVVVPTLGRLNALRTLLTSALPQLGSDDRCLIVAQAGLHGVSQLVEELRAPHGPIVEVITSDRGASIGRNAGVVRLGDMPPETILLFPNDTSWYPLGAIPALRRGLRDAPAAGARVITEVGPRFKLPPPGTRLDRGTVWSVIEMGLVIRLELFTSIGGFDPLLGTGAPSPWQAGEASDLLLRALRERPALRDEFVWLDDPQAAIGGIPEGSGLTPRERAWKLRAYGRGISRVYSTHGYPWHLRWGFVGAGLLVGLRRRDEYRLVDGVPAFIGRFEGATGWVASASRERHAVTR